jgi:DNA-binding GntR family transcriptional regulator
MVDPKGKARGRPRQSSEVSFADCRRLDRESGIPLYWQLSATLFEHLEAGDWQEGARFATERELEEEFGVSRSVVRRALNILVGDGKITSVQGAGAFVASARRATAVFGLVEALIDRREDLTLTVLTAGERRPDSAITRFLELKDDAVPVAHVTAVIELHGRPVGHIDTHVAIADLPWLLPTVRALQAGADPPAPHGPELGRADLLVEHTYFGGWGGLRVGAAAGDPALMVRLVQYTKAANATAERPLEFARLVYRSDRTQLSLELN